MCTKLEGLTLNTSIFMSPESRDAGNRRLPVIGTMLVCTVKIISPIFRNLSYSCARRQGRICFCFGMAQVAVSVSLEQCGKSRCSYAKCHHDQDCRSRNILPRFDIFLRLLLKI